MCIKFALNKEVEKSVLPQGPHGIIVTNLLGGRKFGRLGWGYEFHV